MTSKTYHHGDLRRALLDAATRLVRAQGAANVSLRAIAREAGVSAAAPYHHFDDREALLAEVAAAGFVSMEEAMARAAATDTEAAAPLGRLQAAGVAYVRFAVENAETYRLMFSGLLSDRTRFPSLQRAADSAFASLQRLVGPMERADGEGGLPAVALAAWSTVHGLAFLAMEGLLEKEAGSVGLDEIAREVTLVLGRGLRSYAE